ncbi:cation diffusion facilitator family transporter [Anaeromyxobacter dehalogenans 2CP-1]|uniref:Cation diffusion facilitator family transporter n=1 Tax=Anaeromyxobacter dehalogenans (strain ATCC BAA-258 / DSM 21875 / 2CP-1) TaxID=455488 RepID=B8JB18_ANAD2|nr:CDF family Co(II)/Ni(II) efflux transporter DmeF [Anaeromyxobacter dehalogenans]ACL63829.1 cation diffusion facilitator family transporter [Anaeromyxobacter dehalogenans 2CP-1]
MHLEDLGPWKHGHAFGTAVEASGERRTRWVVALTLAMMVGEIAAGMVYGSMALLADGWHMGTHAAALGVAAFAYAYARRHAADPRYSFGTGKVGALGGFASAVGLAVVALLVLGESAVRLASPVAIRFDQAIGVAVLGLLVNLFSAFLLRDEDHGHAHGHGDHEDHDDHPVHDHGAHGHAHHDHDHDAHAHAVHDPELDLEAELGMDEHRDHNLRAAYLHVLADALTSVLAIVALLAGRVLGWTWMDPVMGIVGALVIARWSVGLLRDTGAVLLDAEVAEGRRAAIRAALEQGEDRVADLHLWRVGPRHLAAIVSVVATAPRAPAEYKERLHAFPDLVHLTVEVHACEAAPGARAAR